MAPPGSSASTNGFVAFRHRDFAFAFAARILSNMASRMFQVAIGWEVWRITGSPLMLGFVGLAMFLPNILFFLAAGEVADRFPRRVVLTYAYAGQAAVAGAMLTAFAAGDPSVALVLALLFLMGTGRTFANPANMALIPNLVPSEHFPNAVAWANSGQHVMTIVGPALGGLLITFGDKVGLGSTLAFATVTALAALSAAAIAMIRSRIQLINRQPVTLGTVFAGLGFILNRQIILGAISLDLFAVLLGGATAMFPIYATEILGLGADGLGLMHSAFAVGEAGCALAMTQIPVRRAAGQKLFLAVAVYGVGIVVFGLSEIVWLSLAALTLAGAADMVSVFIRHNMIQFATPDDMRGRVMAVHGVFTGGSAQLGEFESGSVAALIGPVGSVIFGGLGTIAVVLAFAGLFPNLRRVDALEPGEILRRSQQGAAGTQAAD